VDGLALDLDAAYSDSAINSPDHAESSLDRHDLAVESFGHAVGDVVVSRRVRACSFPSTRTHLPPF
jgi:hypothetical protein